MPGNRLIGCDFLNEKYCRFHGGEWRTALKTAPDDIQNGYCMCRKENETVNEYCKRVGGTIFVFDVDGIQNTECLGTAFSVNYKQFWNRAVKICEEQNGFLNYIEDIGSYGCEGVGDQNKNLHFLTDGICPGSSDIKL